MDSNQWGQIGLIFVTISARRAERDSGSAFGAAYFLEGSGFVIPIRINLRNFAKKSILSMLLNKGLTM